MQVCRADADTTVAAAAAAAGAQLQRLQLTQAQALHLHISALHEHPCVLPWGMKLWSVYTQYIHNTHEPLLAHVVLITYTTATHCQKRE